jgi:tetratricopeptide (TPR) repeat protein
MRAALVAAVCVILVACDRAEDAPPAQPAPTDSADASGEQAVAAAVQPLFQGLGSLHFPITTTSEDAQRYFDQGLMLSFAFNHAAADLAFTEAQKRDPSCALCWWGSALVLGPNVNASMEPGVVERAWEFSQKAAGLAAQADPKERMLAAALAQRYGAQPPTDRAPLDAAYAQAMREVAAAYPQDATIAALTAEALMDVHPWDFWLASGEARPWTQEILTLLEGALQREPGHVGAMHLYIHAVEASQQAERAEGYADRIAALAPEAGHLVHMPAHIYIRIGRYHDGTLTNLKAAEADTRFLAVCHSNGLTYRLGYVPHNYHFGWITAALEGWSAKAIELAQTTAERIPLEMMREPGLETLQQYYVTPLFAGVRFQRWDDVLAFPAPEEDVIYARAIWHYARGRAQIGQDVLDEAQRELDELNARFADPRLPKMTIWNINNGKDVVAVAVEVLSGELAAARGDVAQGIEHLRKAVTLEDALRYNEPPDWFYPVRQSLGAMLLTSGDAAGAQQAFEQDLRIYRENGWSLYGLALALRAQGDAASAQAVEERFHKAWAHADFELKQSLL